MDKSKLTELLQNVKNGSIDINNALDRLKMLPFEDIGHTTIDFHRELRQGIPEVVYCESKSTEQVISIMEKLWENHDRVMGTRAPQEMADQLKNVFPEATYDPISKIITLSRNPLKKPDNSQPFVLIISAGTSDLPVAEEAAQTLEFMDYRVERAYDIGVAGIHRLFHISDKLFAADAVICVAGMEGALTSVVGGVVDCPVIGVPTSVGYGTNLAGFAPLLTMLNSCATGVAIVNIDNGFGAGVFAASVLKRIRKD